MFLEHQGTNGNEGLLVEKEREIERLRFTHSPFLLFVPMPYDYLLNFQRKTDEEAENYLCY